eukprot:CAMPEP_0172444640 /NCGR_PEP_ID=MMETSP1065-20121228/4667_1 /TAXON_ID=265537 /ORGANISM="Amphiprora paludosa, Strain CCMP125" /LENGTH=242 /DNA_ID=CAMNT_0013195263 /DNA_START=103 /DNA_END=831 /DNA_ORIENTATION=-
MTSRRALLRRGSAGVLASAGILAGGKAQSAAAAETEEDVYFGVGCFWHIQHEFVEAERAMLKRGDSQLTSKTGYAGGSAAGEGGRVCYHNRQFLADYGKLGHGEVVGMTLPRDQIVPFTNVYFSLYNPRTKDRVDPMDRGGEYRSLIGLPGGTGHPSYPAMEAAANDAGFKLIPGKGNDPDTLGKQIVFVYDTAKFPFYQAEVYHQYHNDFQSPPYGKAYNDLADLAFDEGRIKSTGCPDRV